MPKPGKYVVAVSGGVDSMALLDMLHQNQDIELVVAHLDHGIRNDSAEDRKLVERVAKAYKVPFVYEQAKLGVGASEDTARQARYEFLNAVVKEQAAQAIITAHHQDDALETAMLNIVRGTGRKGLTSLLDRDDIRRPLLNISKQKLIKYAKYNGLEWREDSTNQDDKYLRNYIRQNILPKLTAAQRQAFIELLSNQQAINHEIDDLLVEYLNIQPGGNLSRQMFSQLPQPVAKEVIASWLRRHNIRDFDSKTLDRLVWAGKVAGTGKSFPVLKGYQMRVNKDNLALVGLER